MRKNLPIIRKICCFLFIILFSFSCFFACSPPGVNSAGGVSGGGTSSGGGGTSSGGDSTGGGSGDGTGGGTGGETVGGLTPAQIAKIENPRLDFISLYSGVYLLIDAEPSTKFYDDVTKSNKTFKEVLDRQFEAIAEQIVYALNIIYGTNAETSHMLSSFPVSIQDFKVLGSAETATEKCGVHTGNNLGLGCADCLAKVAGLRGAFENNPFNFDNTIAGGYEYDEETVAFTQTLRTSSRWVSGTTLSTTSIKEAIARVFADGSFNSNLSYDNALEQIDHLGITKSIQIEDKFTKSEEQMIIDYVLNYVIGTKNVQDDNAIKNLFGANASIQIADKGVEAFTGNIKKHHYKAYEDVVRFVVQKALSIGLDGTYLNDEGVFESGTKTMFPTMPRITIKYFPISYFRENCEGKSYYDTSDMENWDEEDWAEYEENTSKDVVFYNIMKNNQKIIGMIMLPGMDDESLKEHTENLKKKYGEEFVNNWDELGYVYADYICFGFNGVKGMENFLLTPEFHIKAQGETIFDGYIKNDYYKESSGFHKSETECQVFYKDFYVFDECGGLVTSYNLKGAQEENGVRKRMAPYDGVKLVNLLGQYHEDYFVSGKQKVWSNLFDVQPRYNEKDLDTFIPGINAEFKGGNNFVQINFEYYNEAGNNIDAPDMNFFYFNGYA